MCLWPTVAILWLHFFFHRTDLPFQMGNYPRIRQPSLSDSTRSSGFWQLDCSLSLVGGIGSQQYSTCRKDGSDRLLGGWRYHSLRKVQGLVCPLNCNDLHYCRFCQCWGVADGLQEGDKGYSEYYKWSIQEESNAECTVDDSICMNRLLEPLFTVRCMIKNMRN